ncbi:MAG: TetR/AcrR family transcriptional regulator [Dehalococcoidia bacterium]|nr:TetR/AcrR family transcriptional regulator [Dehalococcoidia bacterium]MDD5494133.1 TetR/AcrR family transcriptional regulator [Dehalococcoidia bacterium]
MPKKRKFNHEIVGGELLNGKPRMSRPGGRSSRIQEAVYKAAIDLVLEQDHSDISMRQIAEAAGVNESSLYRRWKTKEILMARALLARAETGVRIPNTGSLRSDLLQLLDEIIAFLENPVIATIIQISAFRANDPEVIAARDIFWRGRFTKISKIFDRAAKRGEISDAFNRQLAIEMLIGTICVRIFLTREPQNEILPEEIVDFILNSVRRRAII